jgi:hypothetical protein
MDRSVTQDSIAERESSSDRTSLKVTIHCLPSLRRSFEPTAKSDASKCPGKSNNNFGNRDSSAAKPTLVTGDIGSCNVG